MRRGIWRHPLIVAARVLVVIVIYAVIIDRVNIGSVVARLTAATAAAFAIAVLLLLGQLGLCTARWRMLVAAGSAPPDFVSSYCINLEGSFFNQILPSTIGGDAWRVFRWRAGGVSVRAAAASVLMDRFSGAMGAAILAMLASFLLWCDGVNGYYVLSIFLPSVAIVGGGIAFVFTIRNHHFVFSYFAGIRNLIAKLEGSLVLDRRFFISLLYSVASYVVCGLAVYATTLSLHLGISLLLTVAVTAAALLVTMIPVSVAGWGIRELSFMALLAPFGVGAPDAFLVGVLFGLAGLVAALAGGVSLLADYGNGRRP